MALHFDTLDDEQMYHDGIADLMDTAPYLAKGISDMMAKLEATEDPEVADRIYDNLTYKVEGMLDGLVAAKDRELATIVRRLFKVLLWAEVE